MIGLITPIVSDYLKIIKQIFSITYVYIISAIIKIVIEKIYACADPEGFFSGGGWGSEAYFFYNFIR